MMKAAHWMPHYPDVLGWKDKHEAAIRQPCEGFEQALIGMLRHWIEYAETMRADGCSIRDDYVLGPGWKHVGQGLLTLLNGNCGRLDRVTLDTIISSNLNEFGFERGDGK